MSVCGRSAHAAGKLADFAILSDTTLSIDPLKIAGIKVVETIKKGKRIYRIGQLTSRQASALCVDLPRCYERLVAFRAHSPLTALFGDLPHLH